MLQHIPKNTVSLLSFLFTFLLLLPSCAKKIGSLEPSHTIFQDAKENIELRAYCLDKKESIERFGKNLLSYGYTPISLTIFNDSDDALLLRASSIDLPIEPAYEVAKSAHIPTLAYTAVPAYIAGLFFWPALIPVAGAGFWMASSNQTLTRKTCAHTFEGDMAQEILPFERISKIFFVKTEYVSRQFTLHIFNVHKKSFIPFTVTLSN